MCTLLPFTAIKQNARFSFAAKCEDRLFEVILYHSSLIQTCVHWFTIKFKIDFKMSYLLFPACSSNETHRLFLQIVRFGSELCNRLQAQMGTMSCCSPILNQFLSPVFTDLSSLYSCTWSFKNLFIITYSFCILFHSLHHFFLPSLSSH